MGAAAQPSPPVETRRAVIGLRIRILLEEHGGEMRADEFCAEHRRRGWAFDDFSPARLGLADGDIIRWTGARLAGDAR